MNPEYLLFSLADAVESGDVERVYDRVARGADVLRRLSTGETLLHKAARAASPELVRYLLQSGVDVNVASDNGATALSIAAGLESKENVTEVTRLLLEAGADPEQGSFGFPALHCAVYVSNVGTTRLLIDAGANVNAVSKTGFVPIRMAVMAMRDMGGGDSDGLTADDRHKLEICELLARAGADASYTPPDPKPDYLTPFQYAMSLGRLDLVRLFVLVSGEDPNQRTLAGRRLMKLLSPHADRELRERANSLLKSLSNSRKTELAVKSALNDGVRVGSVSANTGSRGMSPL